MDFVFFKKGGYIIVAKSPSSSYYESCNDNINTVKLRDPALCSTVKPVLNGHSKELLQKKVFSRLKIT